MTKDLVKNPNGRSSTRLDPSSDHEHSATLVLGLYTAHKPFAKAAYVELGLKAKVVLGQVLFQVTGVPRMMAQIAYPATLSRRPDWSQRT
jgi:hypothetical protein